MMRRVAPQNNSSVLTLWRLKTAIGAWCGLCNLVNNIRYYRWTWVGILPDSKEQQTPLSWRTSVPTQGIGKEQGQAFAGWSVMGCLMLCCVCSSSASLHPLLCWLRCVYVFKLGFDEHEWGKILANPFFFLNDLRTFPPRSRLPWRRQRGLGFLGWGWAHWIWPQRGSGGQDWEILEGPD